MPDLAALETLFNTYWHRGAWRAPPSRPAHREFEHAKSCGIMFDPIRLTRAKAKAWLRKSRSRITRGQVARAFLASLMSRRLDLRSGLGSYAYARRFPKHRCDLRFDGVCCSVCGLSRNTGLEDLNVLSFERHMWGGVRHTDPVYAAFDLECLATTPIPKSARADRQALAAILNAATSLEPRARIGQLLRAAKGTIPGNESELRVLLGILGVCGILEPAASPSYRVRFQRPGSEPEFDSDWAYPVALWRGSDGVNTAAVREWFG